VLPAASAGASFHAAINNGKFHGMIWPQTPIGSRKVEQRRHEFGVRSALGASTGRILASTIKRGVLPAVIGLAAGALMAFVAGTWLEPHLFETSARDPLVFGGAAGVLLLVAVLGALIPARRAAGVDPMVALREG
jgi:ABC-type antimicrobial peptide transport system permease subunit